jgi:hypothetical protein
MFEELLLAVTAVMAKKDHRLEGHQLYISRLPPESESAIFLVDLPKWVKKDNFHNYLEARGRESIGDILFRPDNTGALVLFDSSSKTSKSHRY